MIFFPRHVLVKCDIQQIQFTDSGFLSGASMNKIQTFEQFLSSQSVHVPALNFSINLILAALLAAALGTIYVKYGHSISNRKSFARNLVIIAAATMVVISIVKSSLALSLGLVGALSIVRFRTAIKEPEELAYLFLAITIGLGLGADQVFTTILAVIIILGIIFIREIRSGRRKDEPNLYITVSSDSPKLATLNAITKLIEPACLNLSLKRFDESKDYIEVVYHAMFRDLESFDKAKEELLQLSPDITLSLLDQQGIVR